MSKSVETSAVATERLKRFYDAVSDPDIGTTRAIAGLKRWQGSNGHRLTAADQNVILWAIRSVE